MNYIELIKSKPNRLPLFPLVHTCDGIRFRKILDSKKIAPTLCPVFKEELAYYFYGRPSYRLRDNCCSTSMIALFPVCFVIDTNYINSIKRIFPFDTGAFSANLYQQHIPNPLQMSDFCFEPSLDFAGKFVSYFYGSNENYYKGKLNINASDIPVMSFELTSLHQLIASIGIEAIDDRCYTIEIQSSSSLDIYSEAIKAIVMPSEMLSDSRTVDYMFDHNIEPITYEVYRTTPSSMTPIIIEKVAEYFKRQGVI